MLTASMWILLAFVLLFLGARIAVKTVTVVAHSLHTSSFFVSFFVLGFFTSITEIMIGVNSVIEKRPEIFVGNLLGSTVVVYLLIVPILAIAGNGVKLSHFLKFKEIITAILVAGIPALLTIDNSFGVLDAIISLILYIYFIFLLGNKSELLEKIAHKKAHITQLLVSLFKLSIGVILVFIGSHVLVVQTPILGHALGISPFVISILLLAVGTNIPELTIAITSLISKQKDIAFGNYIGSASLNTFEMGVLTLFGRSNISAEGSNYSVLMFILGLLLFLIFLKSKSEISKKEGLIIFVFYIGFVFCELLTGPGWNLIK